MPVVFHNLKGYDSHMFMKELAKHVSKMGVIAKNTEDYISFSVKVDVDKYIDKNGEEKPKEITLRFIDSIKFMSSSFDSLVNNLTRRGGEFFGFENYSDHQRELPIRKGIYPYKYMDSWDMFKETTFPPASSFYSKLNMSGVSHQDYEHACKVWKDFGIRNLGEYHNYYISELTSYCWQTYLNLLGLSAWIIMDWTQPTSIQPQDWHGKLA